jgi:hypothetical protein
MTNYFIRRETSGFYGRAQIKSRPQNAAAMVFMM